MHPPSSRVGLPWASQTLGIQARDTAPPSSTTSLPRAGLALESQAREDRPFFHSCPPWAGQAMGCQIREDAPSLPQLIFPGPTRP